MEYEKEVSKEKRDEGKCIWRLEMCKERGSSVQGDVRGDVQGDVQGGGVKEEAGAGGSAVDYRALD